MRRATTRISRLPPFALAMALMACSACTYDYSVAREQICNDGTDDDSDGLTDCEDPDCAESVHCIPETDCQNGLDDEGDGLTDCEDPDCQRDPICLGPHPCTNDGTCDSFEDCFWCPDCCPTCALNEGTNHDYIAFEVFTPRSVQEASEIGVDIDGDGLVDNGLGRVLSAFGTENAERMAAEFQRNITNGDFILLSRLVVDGFPSDPGVAFQLMPGLATMDATEDNFTGSGHANVDPEADRENYLCGDLTDGAYSSGPRPFVVPVGLLGSVAYLPVEHGRAVSRGPITASLMQSMHIGGGITTYTINTHLLPFLAVTLNDEIRDDPSGSFPQLLLGYVDGSCSNLVTGCGDVVNGQGECTQWDGSAATPPISATELRCSLFISTALKPDVDLDGDGVNDVLSIGMKFNAMHITIDN